MLRIDDSSDHVIDSFCKSPLINAFFQSENYRVQPRAE